jgi:hypothetical protein
VTRKQFLQTYLVRFAVTLVLVSLLVYVFYHIFGSSSASLLRTPVRTIRDEQIVGGEAYLFRDERLLTVSGAGLVNELVDSGVKISHGVPLAEVWDGVDPLLLRATQSKLGTINRAISILEKSVDTAGTTNADVYRSDAAAAYESLCRAVREGDFAALASIEERLLVALNRYAALSGSRVELENALAALYAERDALCVGNCTTVKNEGASGYFYGRDFVDGYEQSFTKEALFSATADGFFALIETLPAEISDFAIGKTVHQYDWYFGVSFAPTAAGLFSEGERYTFRLPENRGRELEMTCEAIRTASDGRIVAIFSSIEVPPDLLYLRLQHVEITVATSTGYYIPDSALWEIDGVIGVYIFKDSTVYFRRIDVIYRGDGYCIAAEQGDRGADYLSANDILVTSGRGLYHGKEYK